jgi:hypothetical protein
VRDTFLRPESSIDIEYSTYASFSAPGDLWGGLGADLAVGGIELIKVVTSAWHARGPSYGVWSLLLGALNIGASLLIVTLGISR